MGDEERGHRVGGSDLAAFDDERDGYSLRAPVDGPNALVYQQSDALGLANRATDDTSAALPPPRHERRAPPPTSGQCGVSPCRSGRRNRRRSGTANQYIARMVTATAPEPDPSDQQQTPVRGLGRSWKVGADISSWPVLKIAQAARHARDLESRLQIWAANDPVATEGSLAKDGRRWELRLKIRTYPPLLEWALVLGDCLHNLRSSLDGLVWQFAHIDGRTPPNPRALQFPVIRDQSKWADARKRNLQTVPDLVAERIELLQPFNRPAEDISKDPLVLLSDLNNTDKHRSNMVVETKIHGISQRMQVVFENPEKANQNLPPRLILHASPISDGGLVMELETRNPMTSVIGEFSPSFQFTLETSNGHAEVTSTLKQLADYVGQVGAFVTEGPSDPSEEGWVPMTFRQEGDRVISGESDPLNGHA
ncbi:hypothetical protein [Streptomyces sp. NPDC021020]|uniref:hypothetical protein n=1 Tax=Streptomyces sp. NPDC021020 TaxID=3365109 RepID=UPI0037A7386C